MISNTTHACIVYRDENRSNILSNAANLLTESLFFSSPLHLITPAVTIVAGLV